MDGQSQKRGDTAFFFVEGLDTFHDNRLAGSFLRLSGTTIGVGRISFVIISLI